MRCSSCQRQFGWSSQEKGTRAVFCAKWCAREPAMTYNAEELRNQLWEALAQRGHSQQVIADLWGVSIARVKAVVIGRERELGYSQAAYAEAYET